jgi:outer membrane protein assembly factor BamB
MRRTTGSLAVALFLVPFAASAATPIDITTYHYDNFRTGWNQSETTLTPKKVASASFKMIASTVLDDQVDAQPLILGNQPVNGNSAREVVYIATEANTIYAIDANTGAILLSKNFGAPVPRSTLPGQCTNGGPNLGINSTPAIDPASHKIYFIAYTTEHHDPVYRVHAIDPSTLEDTVEPREIRAKSKLTDGRKYEFDPHESRNRAGLLLANGNLYAGFASFCDFDANKSRGWILGWQQDTLTPLKANELTNALGTSSSDFFLSAIWMSGYGLAASAAGDVYFITGNSDPAGNSYDPKKNIAESVVQMSPDLITVKHLFTPMDAVNGWQQLDKSDLDFGSGGIMLLPPQTGAATNLAVAAGKVGVMYVLNADDISDGKKKGGKELSTASVGACWCGPSYYKGADGLGRVVTSGDDTVKVWTMDAGGKTPKLKFDNAPGSVEGGVFFPGFFTSVSSNGTKKGSAVVWAVGRPTDFDQEILKLHAFDPEKGKELFSAVTGSWVNSFGDSNTVPVAANGKVYVATVQSLTIWGLSDAKAAVLAVPRRIDMRIQLAPGQHEVHATVRRIDGKMLTAERRDGTMLAIDTTRAATNYKMAPPSPGRAVDAVGTFEPDGTLKADIVNHLSDHPEAWPADR